MPRNAKKCQENGFPEFVEADHGTRPASLSFVEADHGFPGIWRLLKARGAGDREGVQLAWFLQKTLKICVGETNMRTLRLLYDSLAPHGTVYVAV